MSFVGVAYAQLRILTVPQGGTGATTFTVGECLKGNGTGAITTGACGGGGSLSGGIANALTYWINGTTVGATSSPTVGYIIATSSTASSFSGLKVTGIPTDRVVFTTTGGALTSHADYTYTNSAGLSVAVNSGQRGLVIDNLNRAQLGDIDSASGGNGLDTETSSTLISSSGDWVIFKDTGDDFYVTERAETFVPFMIQGTTGNVGIGTTSPYSKLSVVGQVVATNYIGTTTASSTFGGGIDASRVCLAGTTTCLGTSGGSGTVTSVTLATPNSTLSLGGTNPVTTSGTINADLNLTNPNIWTGLQRFNSASSTVFSNFGTAYFGGTATTTIVGNLGTSTFSSFISATSASTTATSTMSGINIPYNNGCFAIVGTCLPRGSATANQVAFWQGSNSLAGDTGLTFNPSTDILTSTYVLVPGGGGNDVNITSSGIEIGVGISQLASDGSGQFATGGLTWSNAGAITAITGVSGATGVYDFGGGSSFEIPSGTNPTVDATGEIAINTTAASSSLTYYDGVEESNIYSIIPSSFTVFATSSLNSKFVINASTTQRIGFAGQKSRLDRLMCAATGGSFQLRLGDGSNWTATTVFTTGTTTVTSFTNNTFEAYEPIWFEVRPLTSAQELTCTRFFKNI